jgi:cysteine desulfurase
MTKQFIYMDHAAATPVDRTVLAAMQPYFTDNFYNPSAIYLAARAVKQDVSAARAEVAKVIGAKPSEIIFTPGGTEANNLAIAGIMRKYPNSNCVIASTEHESIQQVAARFAYKEAMVDAQGVVDIASLTKVIGPKTVLVSVAYANSEIGTIQPLTQISKLVQAIRQQRKQQGNSLPLYLHTDASQAACYLDMHVHKLGVDLLTLNGGKMYGPKQSGALYVKTGIDLSPLILGGGQEANVRSGTENVPAIIGFARALHIAHQQAKNETTHMLKLQTYFIDRLQKTFPNSAINGSLKHRLPNNIHVTLPGIDNERVVMELDERGIMCATGSACSASSEKPSKVLEAIGLSHDESRASLRFTMGRSTTTAQIDKTMAALSKILHQ